MNPAAEFYDRMIAQEGANPRGLALASRASQHLRFSAWLSSAPVAANDSVLDVGCGFADLYDFLVGLGHQGDYAGWDISASAVAEARRRHPEIADRLTERDALDAALDAEERHDWVVCSGTFNVGLSSADGLAALRPLYARANKGLVVTFQNAYGTTRPAADDGYERAKYTAESAYAEAKALTPWVVVRDDYLPHDFLIAVLRRPSWELVAGVEPLAV